MTFLTRLLAPHSQREIDQANAQRGAALDLLKDCTRKIAALESENASLRATLREEHGRRVEAEGALREASITAPIWHNAGRLNGTAGAPTTTTSGGPPPESGLDLSVKW